MYYVFSIYIKNYAYAPCIISIILMGIGYSLLAAALWPIVALIVPIYRQGTAFGNIYVKFLRENAASLPLFVLLRFIEECAPLLAPAFWSALHSSLRSVPCAPCYKTFMEGAPPSSVLVCTPLRAPSIQIFWSKSFCFSSPQNKLTNKFFI